MKMIGIIMIVYQYVLLMCDFVHLVVIAAFLTAKSMWYLLFPPPMKSVTGEIILVTGAGHGIGRELGLQFARMGAKVVCLDINEANNTKTVTDIKREGGNAWGYKCDVSSQEEVQEVSRKIRQEAGEVTILVNNAAIMPCKPFIKHTSGDIKNIFNVNLFAHFWTLQEWLPSFLAAGRGHVVAVSSIAGLMATSNIVPYCSSKYAVKGLMDGMTEELRYGGRNPNIKFTCVHPFIIDTGLTKKPRIRFPSFNPITTPETCAAKIIEGVCREEEVVCIPSRDYYGHIIMGLLPREVRKAFLDFMDTGVDEDC
ncbi:epidermal retinol dehydrogenase 2-like isoform X2 [Homarus americanus]|uniref:epidermal retinol dehydrogenase 2-like isoform X2 n=1 Tax=Homarus americanus TaxID=6706 RepID=UPI001C4451E8|nr:epidermal retinol dehydrogenase 2-like isoform X2 [Homarus americanus]